MCLCQVKMHSWAILSSYLHCSIFNRFEYDTTYTSIMKKDDAVYWQNHSQNHRFRLEGTFLEHLVQSFCSSRVSYSRLPRITSNWVLGISTDGELYNQSGQDSQRILQLPISRQPTAIARSIGSTGNWLWHPFLLPRQFPTLHPHQISLWKPRIPPNWGRGGRVPIRDGSRDGTEPHMWQSTACPYPRSPQRLQCKV